jgi:hypothetical protein
MKHLSGEGEEGRGVGVWLSGGGGSLAADGEGVCLSGEGAYGVGFFALDNVCSVYSCRYPS